MTPGAGYFNHIIEQMDAARASGSLIEASVIIRRYLIARDGFCFDSAAIDIARIWMDDHFEGWVALTNYPPGQAT